MKVFIAASYAAIKDAREVAVQLEMRGHEVTSSWLNEPFDHFEEDWQKMACATIDFHDVERSDAFVVLTEVPSSSGGFHTEIGMALGMRIPVYVLGPRNNIYLHIPGVKDFDEFEPGVIVGGVPLWHSRDWQEGDVEVTYGNPSGY